MFLPLNLGDRCLEVGLLGQGRDGVLILLITAVVPSLDFEPSWISTSSESACFAVATPAGYIVRMLDFNQFDSWEVISHSDLHFSSSGEIGCLFMYFKGLWFCFVLFFCNCSRVFSVLLFWWWSFSSSYIRPNLRAPPPVDLSRNFGEGPSGLYLKKSSRWLACTLSWGSSVLYHPCSFLSKVFQCWSICHETIPPTSLGYSHP